MIRTQKDIAFADVETIAAFNNELLRQHVRYCYEKSPFYRSMFDRMHIRPQQIQRREDIGMIPLTTKADLEEHNHEFLCVTETEIVDLCQTSGTTGKVVNVLQTAGDLERVGYNEEISFKAAGVNADDRVMVACAMGRCFMAGLAYFEGVRRIGAMAIRVGSGNPAILARAVMDHHPTVIVCVPSQGLLMAKAISQAGGNAAQLGVRRLICIGEPVRNQQLSLNALGARLHAVWGCQIHGTYASTEMASSFTDCQSGMGGHFHPELVVVEVVDENGSPVLPGVVGEVIVTPVQVTGMPLLRFCTGDMAAYYTEPCRCGRHTYRLGAILGRKQQKMKIRGTTVYPSAVYSVLQEIPEVENYYLEVYDDHQLSERLCVVVGVDAKTEVAVEDIEQKIRARIRVTPEVVVTSSDLVAARIALEDKRKPVVFFDYRGKSCSA